MRVLILTPSIYPQPGGLQRYTYNLATSLCKQGHEVQVLTLLEPSSFSRPCQALFYKTVGKWGSVPSNPVAQFRQKADLLWILWSAVRSFCPDQVIVTWWDPWGYLIGMLNLWFRVPMICIVHAQEILQFPSNRLKRMAKRLLCQSTLRASTVVVAVSRYTKEKLVTNFQLPHSKIRVIPNGLTDDYIRVSRDFSRNTRREDLDLRDGYVILQSGRVVQRKGHEYILRILPRLKQILGTTVYYVIVGSGPHQDYLKQRARELNVAQDVRTTGFVSDDVLHAYYSVADVVVMPAYITDNDLDVEGFGIVFLEAYAHGKPVVGVDAGGVSDAVLPGETGFLIARDDIEGLENAIITLLKDRTKAKAMGLRGQQLLQMNWHWDQLSNQILFCGKAEAEAII